MKQCEFSIALGGGNFKRCEGEAVAEINIGRRKSEYYDGCVEHVAAFKAKREKSESKV